MSDTTTPTQDTNDSKFIYPYTESEADQQLVFKVSKADHGLIKCNRPLQGTLRIVGAVLWKKLADLCRSHAITDMTKQDEFESLVMDIVLVPKDEYETLVSESAMFRQSRAAVGSINEPTSVAPATSKPASKKRITKATDVI